MPIGDGQTISQPYMVAIMTQSLDLVGGEKILEIGTGSGYQTAVLAELARMVFTVERLFALIQKAEIRLRDLGYENIHCRLGDGSQGWSEKAPFDGIIVTAGAPEVPGALKSQLSEGGRLVIPVGSRYSQNLLKVTPGGEPLRGRGHHRVRFCSPGGRIGMERGMKQEIEEPRAGADQPVREEVGNRGMMKRKAFSLLSGGLDSLLATRLIMAQGIEVIGLHFITPFFGYERKGREADYAERMRREYGIEARVIDVGEEYFQILRHPRYGYGKNFNPCVDCKVFLFSKAKQLLEEEKRIFW